MISGINYGRWLTRLGFKTQAQPPVIQTVQPVVLMGDYEGLISPQLFSSGIVGCDYGAIVGACPCIQFFGPNPAWLHFWMAGPAVGQAFVRIGYSPTTRPTCNNPVILPKQEFNPNAPALMEVRRGEGVNLASQDFPMVRVGASNSSYPPRVFKPAGGWVDITFNTSNASFEFGCTYYELPNENAQ